MKKSNAADDAVEEMLRAAQDELLLNLSLNSHTTRANPDHLLPDLDRRFQALKSAPSKRLPPQQLPPHHQNTSAPASSATSQEQDPDDLLARFAALKASSSASETVTHSPPSDDEEDEVEKIIRWAKDAARLDPSPPSDLDVDQTDGDDESDHDDDSDRDDDPVKK